MFMYVQATTWIYTSCHTLSLHSALPICRLGAAKGSPAILFAQLAVENPALGERLSALTATQHVDAIGRVPYGWRATGTQPGVFRLGDQADRKSTRLNSSH